MSVDDSIEPKRDSQAFSIACNNSKLHIERAKEMNYQTHCILKHVHLFSEAQNEREWVSECAMEFLLFFGCFALRFDEWQKFQFSFNNFTLFCRRDSREKKENNFTLTAKLNCWTVFASRLFVCSCLFIHLFIQSFFHSYLWGIRCQNESKLTGKLDKRTEQKTTTTRNKSVHACVWCWVWDHYFIIRVSSALNSLFFSSIIEKKCVSLFG